MGELADRLKKIISEQLLIDLEKITDESTFEDLGADSLDTVEMIMEFEDEFEIKIPDADLEDVSTVGEAIAYLEKRKADEDM